MSYVTGTGGQGLTLAAGATSGAIAGILLDFEDVIDGDKLIVGGLTAVINTVTAASGDFTLKTPWPGTALAAVTTWVIERSSTLRNPGIFAAQRAVEIGAYQSRLLTQAMPVIVNSTLNTPPASPSIGAVYRVGTAPTGAWVGSANCIAEWQGRWIFSQPITRLLVIDPAAQTTTRWDGTTYVVVGAAGVLPGSVGTPQIMEEAVTTTKIAPAAITRDRLAPALSDLVQPLPPHLLASAQLATFTQAI